MTYSVKMDNVSDEKWEEMRNIATDYTCAICGKDLTIHTNPEAGTLEVSCIDREHHGWLQRTTAVQKLRRAGEMESYQPDLGRAMNQLALRYPKAIVDKGTAALFIVDCMRLGLDPLIQPAEIVPVTYTINRGLPDEKKIIQEIVTLDGWLSMAARGCPEKWAGAPSIDPVFDSNTAESLSGDKRAWLYKAAGQFRLDDGTLSPVSTVYGYFTQAEFLKAKKYGTPAADNPGNQAAVRAVKRWVRQNFPDCRQRMMELYKEWRQRAQGVKEVEEYIDAEYSLLDEAESDAERKFGGAASNKKEKPIKKTKASTTNFHEAKTSSKKSEVPAAEVPPSAAKTLGATIAGIDVQWLNETLQELKWTTDTTKTFLAKYNVSLQGTVDDVLKRLTREQATDFVNELQRRSADKQIELFT